MELVEGNNLRDYIANGTSFDEQDTVSIMSQLLDALHYAHNATVWHRDIKPANIMVMSNGRIKLTDFGIARLESADRTRTNVIMGTPGYIAPELYLGGHLDHRMDIFAAGVVFYQLLARRSPFRGGPEAIMHDVCYHDPEPASKADPAHRWPQYDAIVARALAKAPGDRFQSAGEFRTAILDAYAQPVCQHDLRGHDRDAPLALGVSPIGPRAAAARCRRRQRHSRCRARARRRPPDGAAWCSPASKVEIAKYVGPVAKVLVRRAAKEHKDLESLVGALMPAIDDLKERSAFARAVIGKPMTTPLRGAPRASEGTASPGTRPGDALSAGRARTRDQVADRLHRPDRQGGRQARRNRGREPARLLRQSGKQPRQRCRARAFHARGRLRRGCSLVEGPELPDHTPACWLAPDREDPLRERRRPHRPHRSGAHAADPAARRPCQPHQGGRSSRRRRRPGATLQHLVAGINPLLVAAGPLLALQAQLRATTAHNDRPGLQRQLLGLIGEFEESARASGVSRPQVIAARYLLCTFIDEAIAATPWGANPPPGHEGAAARVPR